MAGCRLVAVVRAEGVAMPRAQGPTGARTPTFTRGPAMEIFPTEKSDFQTNEPFERVSKSWLRGLTRIGVELGGG